MSLSGQGFGRCPFRAGFRTVSVPGRVSNGVLSGQDFYGLLQLVPFLISPAANASYLSIFYIREAQYTMDAVYESELTFCASCTKLKFRENILNSFRLSYARYGLLISKFAKNYSSFFKKEENEMTFSDIINEISHISPIQVISSSSDTNISRVRLWAGQDESEMSTILYFGYDRQPGIWPDHYILAADAGDAEFAGRASDFAVIPKELFAEVFNRTQDILSERNENDYLHYLMDTADSVRSVDELIDMASQTFNASLILIDRDFRILSHSTRIPVTDELWVDNIRKGYCDYEFITEVKKLKSVQMANPGTVPFEVTCSASPYKKLACRVYCKDAWIGSLLLIEGDQTYRPEHYEMLRMLSSVTGYALLSYSPELLYRTSEYQSFLYNLLIGTPVENLPEAYRDMKFQENMKLLYFRPDSSGIPSIKGKSLREAFHRELPDCHVITYRKATIVVCSAAGAEGVGHLLDLFPSKYKVNVGISNPFHRIELLREALSEAQDALVTGKSIEPGRRVFSFEEFSVSVMLKHFSETGDISRYIHPAVSCIAQYDEEYKAQLLETVRVYIQSGCSIKKTAEALYLHRNSVIYRLRKAEEIGGLDLNDADTQFALRMSFYIIQVRPGEWHAP